MDTTHDGGLREWLILDPYGRCYWRAERKGYSDIVGAGLYTTMEADSIVSGGRGDRKVHVTDAHVQAALKHAREGLAYFDACARAQSSPQSPGDTMRAHLAEFGK